MTDIYLLAALWLGLALAATLLSIWLRIATAMSEILVGTVAYFTKGKYWAVAKDPYAHALASANGAKAGKTRKVANLRGDLTLGEKCAVVRVLLISESHAVIWN